MTETQKKYDIELDLENPLWLLTLIPRVIRTRLGMYDGPVIVGSVDSLEEAQEEIENVKAKYADHRLTEQSKFTIIEKGG